VFASVRRESDAQALSSAGTGIEPLLMDVTDAVSVASAAASVTTALAGSGLAGLVNNAGISVDVPLECVDIATLRHQLEVNAVAPVVVTQALLPLLRRAQGRVINVSSVNGRVASPFSGPYCMSKFALEAFTDCLRQELAPWHMHVVSVEPGAIGTPMWDKGRRDDWAVTASPHDLALYGKAFGAFRDFSERNAAAAIPADAVSRVIHKALTATTPRTRYLVGNDARVYARLAQLFPDWVVDWIGRRVMGL